MKHMVRGFVCLAFVAGVLFAASAETTIYVDHNSMNPVSPYGDLTTAAKTISDAMVVAADAQDAVVIIVQPGPYAETGFTLDKAITVRGATGDPADVTITDAVSGKRAFTITHADARIEALTITGAGMRSTSSQHGGHLSLSAGMVSNCVIEGGHASADAALGVVGGNVYMTGGVVEDSILRTGWVGRNGRGGNVYMTGGVVRRCRILEGTANNSAQSNYDSVAAGLYATAGLIDSCLLAGNKVTKRGYCGGMYLAGTATAVNCTVVGSRVDTTANPHPSCLAYGFGVHIASADAKVINTVMYDNGGDAQKEYGTKNLGNYINCASSVANDADMNWKTIGVVDFSNCAQGDYTLPPASRLVDAGTTDAAVYPADASATDLLGNVRVSKTLIDIGCYETDQSIVACSGLLSTYGTLEGAEIVCTAKATGFDGGILYEWDFGNGEIKTTDQANYTYAYPDAGLFTVSVSASGDGGKTWTAPYELLAKIVVVPTVMYVDSANANPVFPYKEKSTAANSIMTVMNAMTNNLSGGVSCVPEAEVCIVAGSRLTDSGMILNEAITIRGESDDPADVIITHSGTGKRTFTLAHADALVENLTVSGSGAPAQNGCHVSVSAGTVRNCVIEGGTINTRDIYGGNVHMTGGVVEDSIIRNGKTYGRARGGNVYMTGGVVRRCKIQNGDAYSYAATGGYEGVGGGVYAEGGLVDSCLLVGNKVSKFGYCGGMWLGGTATAVNCTVVGSTVDGSSTKSASYLSYGFGVQIASTTAKAINTVMYDNGGDAQKEYGTANLGNYVNCASTIDNESDVGWQTIDENDFTAYKQGDYTLPLTSKLVDAGTLAEGVYPADASTTDLIGNARVSITLIDIGCYEADKSQASCSGSLSVYAVHEGSDVTCSAEAAGIEGDIIYKWDFGNGTVITTNLANFAYAYPNAGLFTVSVAASGDDGATWTAPFVLPTKIVVAPSVMYVNSESENPSFPYKGKEAAAKTITAVLNVMTNNDSQGLACVPGVEVRIVSGSQLTDSGMVLNEAIVIRGESDNPTNVVITHNGTSKRAFTLNHADALIENLTISGSGARSVDGGHLSVSKGTVRNCIVENGQGAGDVSNAGKHGVNVFIEGGLIEDSVIRGAKNGFKTFGGNVAMVGGCVRRCKILNGAVYSGANLSSGGYESRGGGVYISGGVLENCLVASNVVGRFSYTAGIYLDGAGTVVNCTVVGGTVSSTDQSGSFDTYGVGIHIANSKGRVINTVVYDNGGTAQKEFGTTCLDGYDYCASSVANESAAHWTTITAADFSDYAAWTSANNVEGLRPGRRPGANRLIGAGTKWDEYLELGATSTTDLCGGARLLGKRVDIGCLENFGLGMMLFVR